MGNNGRPLKGFAMRSVEENRVNMSVDGVFLAR